MIVLRPRLSANPPPRAILAQEHVVVQLTVGAAVPGVGVGGQVLLEVVGAGEALLTVGASVVLLARVDPEGETERNRLKLRGTKRD